MKTFETLFLESIDNDLLTEKAGARCTKVTGQMSSTRSDKKYMRCARVNGTLKRIHYGDPNLRIKKSNSKRRKASEQDTSVLQQSLVHLNIIAVKIGNENIQTIYRRKINTQCY